MTPTCWLRWIRRDNGGVSAPLEGLVGRGCERCDTFGGTETYANQVTMPIAGKAVCIDWCIHQIVSALNAGGVRTVACCCGHGRVPGRIDLEDGRVLTIATPNAELGAERPGKD